MSRSAIRKVTLSLPDDLVGFADSQAERRRETRSRVIGDLLREAQQRELDTLAGEGYRFFAGEAEEFAAASQRAVSEALADDRAPR